MGWIARTLWDLLGVSDDRQPAHGRDASPTIAPPPRPPDSPPDSPCTPPPSARPAPARQPMQQRYDDLVREMKKTYDLRVRKWRNSSSGCAWIVSYHDGSISRLIESPYPRGPMSCAIFLHEVGHHAIGFGTYKPRCLEEYHAWKWSLETMAAYGLNVTPAVERRMAESLHYAVVKARRRGLKRLPAALEPYLTPPDRLRPVLNGSASSSPAAAR